MSATWRCGCEHDNQRNGLATMCRACGMGRPCVCDGKGCDSCEYPPDPRDATVASLRAELAEANDKATRRLAHIEMRDKQLADCGARIARLEAQVPDAVNALNVIRPGETMRALFSRLVRENAEARAFIGSLGAKNVPCRCGSGAHPRKCERHPWNFAAHIAEMNVENLEGVADELAAVKARMANMSAVVEAARTRGHSVECAARRFLGVIDACECGHRDLAAALAGLDEKAGS